MRLLTRSLAAVARTATWHLSVPAVKPLPGLTNPSRILTEKLDAAAAALEQVANVREDFQQQFEPAAPSDRDRIADDARMPL